MKLHRHLKSTVCAAIFAASAFSAVAATPAAVMTPQQAQYVRMHQTATAFVNSIANTAERYGQFQNVNQDQVRALLSLSEQAAQRNDFDQASLHARAAYEVLRTAIMDAVAKSQAATRPSGR